MPVIIEAVTITPNQLNVGEQYQVKIKAYESTWDSVRTELQSWGEVRRSFASWTKVKDFIYSIPNPTPDSDVMYSSDTFALFDVDANQISINGGATLTHTAEEVDQFVKEVKNE